jgi:hypothetical protein
LKVPGASLLVSDAGWLETVKRANLVAAEEQATTVDVVHLEAVLAEVLLDF